VRRHRTHSSVCVYVFFFLFLRPSRIQKSGLLFSPHFPFFFFYILHGNFHWHFGPSPSNQSLPIWQADLHQLWCTRIWCGCSGNDSPIGGATATNPKSQYMISYKPSNHDIAFLIGRCSATYRPIIMGSSRAHHTLTNLVKIGLSDWEKLIRQGQTKMSMEIPM